MTYTKTPQALLEHILWTHKDSPFKELNNSEKIFYFSLNSLSYFNKGVGKGRSASFSAEAWAKKLDYSKSKIFALQESLEKKGYVKIIRQKDKRGKSYRNVIIPTLPEGNFNYLCKTARDRYGYHDPFNYSKESYLDYLDRTKMFVLLDYTILKQAFYNPRLSSLSKLIFLWINAKIYISKKDNITLSYKELSQIFSCSESSISRSINSLASCDHIAKTKVLAKNEDSNRWDKILWNISIIPNSIISLKENRQAFVSNNKETAIAESDPPHAQISQYNNKNRILNNKVNLCKQQSCLQRLYEFDDNSLCDGSKTLVAKYAASAAKRLCKNRDKDRATKKATLYRQFLNSCTHWKPYREFDCEIDRVKFILNICMSKSLNGEYKEPKGLSAAKAIDSMDIDISSNCPAEAVGKFALLEGNEQGSIYGSSVPDEYHKTLGEKGSSDGKTKLDLLVEFISINCGIDKMQMIIMMNRYSPQQMRNAYFLTHLHGMYSSFSVFECRREFLNNLKNADIKNILTEKLMSIYSGDMQRVDACIM